MSHGKRLAASPVAPRRAPRAAPLRGGLALGVLLSSPAWLLACGGGDPTPAKVKAVIDDLAAQRFGTATARYRADEAAILSPTGASEWRRGLVHEDATVREWSVDALARIGEPQDVTRVVQALDDPFRRVQEAAARGIVAMDPEAARQAFTERLSGGEALQQMIAAQGLADLGDAAGVEPLLAELDRESTEEAVRGVIVQSLAILGDPRAVAALARIADDREADLQLRRNAAEALATFEQEAASEALRGLVDSDDPYVQEVARRAIAGRR